MFFCVRHDGRRIHLLNVLLLLLWKDGSPHPCQLHVSGDACDFDWLRPGSMACSLFMSTDSSSILVVINGHHRRVSNGDANAFQTPLGSDRVPEELSDGPFPRHLYKA